MSTSAFTELTGKAALKRHLKELYPNLSRRDFKRKLNNSTSFGEYAFFSAFVAYFYDLLARMPYTQNYPDLHGIDSIRGWCIGDARVENFGTIWIPSKTGKAHTDFTVNNPTNGAPAPLYADLLRLLTGLLLTETPPSLCPIINAYRQGLDGDSALSPVAADQIKVAAKLGNKPEKLVRLTKKGKLKPTKKQQRTFIFVSKTLKQRIPEKLFKTVKPIVKNKYRICGYWALKKRSGSSSGLRRYWVLLLPKTGKCKFDGAKGYLRKKALVLELKKLQRPEIWPLVCHEREEIAKEKNMACTNDPLAIMTRVGETLDIERNQIIFSLGDVTLISGTPYLLRPRWQGNRGVNLSRIVRRQGPRDLALILKDEARVLGRIHRESLPAGSHYSAHIYALADSLTEVADQLAQVFRLAYQTSQV